MFREAGIECRASHSGGGSSSSTGRGSRGGTFTGPTAAASAATTAVAAALSLSRALFRPPRHRILSSLGHGTVLGYI